MLVVDAGQIVVEEFATPDAESLSLQPADSNDRIVVVGSGAEIVAGEVIVHGVGVVMNPAQGVGIDVDALFVNEGGAVVQASGTSGIEGAAMLFSVLGAHFLAGSVGIVNPVVFIVQLGSIDFTTAKISIFLSHIEVGEGFANFRRLPINLGLIVDVFTIIIGLTVAKS